MHKFFTIILVSWHSLSVIFNLQMSISAKVDDIMTKIDGYSVKWSNVCCISSFLKFCHK